jgi:cytochrome o ubiquinol oxidase subunit 2
MIYAMPGMESRLNAVMNLPGSYDGFSTNYSGAGFSGMRFTFEGLDQPGFDLWIARARVEGQPTLGRAEYLELAKPSENVPPSSFSDVDPDLFRRVVNRCVEEGRLCIDQMAALDARGGTGLAGTLGTIPAADRVASAFGARPFYAADICTAAESAAFYGERGVALLDTLPRTAAAGTDETF